MVDPFGLYGSKRDTFAWKARGWQGAEDYPSVDKWGTIILEKKNNSLW